MTTGILEATLGAAGDELANYGGLFATRLTAQHLPEGQRQSAAQTLDYDGATGVSLSAGAFAAAVVPGDVIRILSGALAGAEAVILSGASGTAAAVLVAAFPGAAGAVAGLSWEAVRPAETTFNVESTLGWTTAGGELRVAGVRYRYTGLTATTLTGIEHWDVDQWVTGVAQQHEPLETVLDWTRTRSALEQLRRSFFVGTATGSDLDTVARNEGVDRPPEMGDEAVFRAYVQAVAYAYKGTLGAVEAVLDVVLGAGNWESFEDLTKATERAEPGHHNTVYFRRTAGGTAPVGQAYIEDVEVAPLLAADNLDLVRSPVHVSGVRLARDESDRLVGSGTGAVSVDTGRTITLLSGTWPTEVRRGDVFTLTSGSNRGLRGVIWQVTPTDLTLLVQPGQPVLGRGDTGNLGINFNGLDWRITRPRTNAGYYRPSDDQAYEAEYVPAGRVAAWGWVGTGVEATAAVPGSDPVHGDRMNLIDSNPANVAGYQRLVRIEPESDAVFELFWDPVTLDQTSGPRQACMVMVDGARAIAVGAQLSASGHPEVGFFDVVTNTFIGTPIIGSGAFGTSYSPGLQTWRIIKRGDRHVELYHQAWQGFRNTSGGRVVQRALVSAFPTSAAWVGAGYHASAVERELTFGHFSTAATVDSAVKYASWRTGPMSRDYFNERLNMRSNGLNTLLEDPGTGVLDPVADVGAVIRKADRTAINALGGSSRGEWEVVSVAGDQATVIGPTRGGLIVPAGQTNVVQVHVTDAWRWPDVLGHQLEILSGVNAGTYEVYEGVDESQEYQEITVPPLAANTSRVCLTALGGSFDDAGCTVRIWGLVGGVVTFEDVNSRTAQVLFPTLAGGGPGFGGFTISAPNDELGNGRISTTTWDAGSIVAVEIIEADAGLAVERLQIRNCDPTLPDFEDRLTDTTPIFDWAWRELRTQGRPSWRTWLASFAGQANLPEVYTRTVRVRQVGGAPAALTPNDTEASWRLLPQFPTEVTTTLGVLPASGTVAANNVAFRNASPFAAGQLMEVERVEQSSAHIVRAGETNTDLGGGNRSIWPLYIHDSFGYVRFVLDAVRMAGTHFDFDSLSRDAAGLHIQE